MTIIGFSTNMSNADFRGAREIGRPPGLPLCPFPYQAGLDVTPLRDFLLMMPAPQREHDEIVGHDHGVTADFRRRWGVCFRG